MTFHEPTTIYQFEDLLKRHDVCVVDFFASWCRPCKLLSDELHKMLIDNPVSNLCVIKLDVDNDEFSDLVDKFDIEGIPYVVFYKNGEHVNGYVVNSFVQSKTATEILLIANKLMSN